MDKKLLEIYELVGSNAQNHSYTIILDEVGGRRRLPIVIGSVEARAIAVGMGNIAPKRPQTHDLIVTILESLNANLIEMVISNFLEGVFYASLVCEDGNGQEIIIDSRTSDAIALAVRYKCPIYAYETVLDSAGIVFEDQFSEHETSEEGEEILIDVLNTDSEDKDASGFKSHSIQELQKMLSEALDQENYEKAARIRDEIESRK